MSVIIPAILAENLEDFTQKFNLVRKFEGAQSIQIDFADGKFVNHTTLPPASLPNLPLAYQFTAHLMVENPAKYFNDLSKAGFEEVAMHIESFTDPQNLIKAIIEARDLGMAAQVAINPDTAINKLASLLPKIDSILVMGVDPGFQGSKFQDRTMERINLLRLKNFYGKILVDGGIKKEKIQELLAAGVDALIIGSAIFASKNPAQAFTELSAEAGESI